MEAGCYSVGAVLGFYVLLTRLQFSPRTLPRVEGASWLLALFLFSMALWADSRAVFTLMGMRSADVSISDLFWLVGAGALVLFLLRLTSADPEHHRLGAAVMLFMIAGLNALLIRFVLTADIDKTTSSLFLFARHAVMLAQFALAAIPLARKSVPHVRLLWITLDVGILLAIASNLSMLGVAGEFAGVLAAAVLGLLVPLQLVRLERGEWPKLRDFMKEDELRIAVSAFVLIFYLLVFTEYFHTRWQDVANAESRLHDNLFFFLSACWLYLLFGALAWYARYRHSALDARDEWKGIRESLDSTVAARTKDLSKRLGELERFRKVAEGREIRMIELKKKAGKRRGSA